MAAIHCALSLCKSEHTKKTYLIKLINKLPGNIGKVSKRRGSLSCSFKEANLLGKDRGMGKH